MRRRCFLLSAVLMLGLLAGCGGQQEELDRTRIRSDTTYLCQTFPDRVTGTEGERRTCDWLEEQLEQAGFSYQEGTLLRQSFSGLKGKTSENLTALCNRGGDPVLCVTAHYDNVEGSPGARDNGAAVAVLLELARCLGQEQPEQAAEIRLIFLGSEENGYYGSRAYLESLSPEERERHLAVFNMDISAATRDEGELVCCTLGGWEDGQYREGDIFSPAENRVSQAVSEAGQKILGGPVPVVHGGESDHVTFHQWGIDAANVCWRRLEDGFPVLPSEYHKPEDKAETIDYETAWTTGRCVLEALRLLGGEISTPEDDL